MWVVQAGKRGRQKEFKVDTTTVVPVETTDKSDAKLSAAKKSRGAWRVVLSRVTEKDKSSNTRDCSVSLDKSEIENYEAGEQVWSPTQFFSLTNVFSFPITRGILALRVTYGL